METEIKHRRRPRIVNFSKLGEDHEFPSNPNEKHPEMGCPQFNLGGEKVIEEIDL